MTKSHQREWIMDVLEAAPSLAFFAVWRTGFDLELAGWIGAGLAAVLLLYFGIRKVRFNPILLGINLHLLIITPLIVALFHFGASDVGAVLEAHSYKAVLVTIFLAGLILTLFAPTGFVGANGLSPTTARVYSSLLLLASAAAILWAFTRDGGAMETVGLPIFGLFALRRLLIARGMDGSASVMGPALIGGGAALSTDSDF